MIQGSKGTEQETGKKQETPECNKKKLNHFRPMLSFYTPWWYEMGKLAKNGLEVKHNTPK